MSSTNFIAQVKKIPDKFWKNETIIKKTGIVDLNALPNDIKKKIYITDEINFNGLLFHYKRHFYIATNYQKIANIDDIHMIDTQNKKVKLDIKEVYHIPEFGLSVIEIHDNGLDEIVNLDYSSEDKLFSNLDNYYIKVNDEIINVKIKDTIIDSLYSNLTPKIPLIKLNLLDSNDTINLDTIIGTPIYHNDNVFGIISCFTQSCSSFLCLSVNYLIYILDNDFFSKTLLKTLKFSSQVVDFEFDDKTYLCHMVTDNFNLTYAAGATSYDKKEKIPNDCLIYKINEQFFTSDNGLIYCDKINTYVPVDTYVLLNSEHDSISMEYFIIQDPKPPEKIISKNIKINPIPINNILSIKPYSNNKVLIYNGLVFMELCEELLQYYDNLGYNIIGTTIDTYNNKKTNYNGDNNCYIVLVDVLYESTSLSENFIKLYTKHNLPMINIEKNNYIIPMVSRVNSKKITDLNIMESLLTGKVNMTLSLDNNNKSVMKLKYSDNNTLEITL